MSFYTQVQEEPGATQFAHALRGVAAQAASAPLSDAQIATVSTLADLLAAYAQRVRALLHSKDEQSFMSHPMLPAVIPLRKGHPPPLSSASRQRQHDVVPFGRQNWMRHMACIQTIEYTPQHNDSTTTP